MRFNKATQILLKLNQSFNTILSQSQSPSPSQPPPPSDDTNFFTQILMQLNEWLLFLPNLVLSFFANFASFFSNLIQDIQSFFANLASFFPNLIHDIHSFFAKLVALFPDLIHYLVAILKEALPYVVAAVGVVALCVVCFYFFSAIISCIALVVRGCWMCIQWLLTMLWGMCQMVFCCGGNTVKMMVAPGTGGAMLIQRAVFEAAPQAYFAALRAAGGAVGAGARVLV